VHIKIIYAFTEHTRARFGQKNLTITNTTILEAFFKSFTMKNQAENLQTSFHQKLLPRVLSQSVNIEIRISGRNRKTLFKIVLQFYPRAYGCLI
jgi:hypothetical protein